MLIGGLGPTELIVVLFLLAITVGVPLIIIILVIYFVRRKRKTDVTLKKCAFCAYSIPVEATVCGVCGKELPR